MCQITSSNDQTWSDSNYSFIAHHWLERTSEFCDKLMVTTYIHVHATQTREHVVRAWLMTSSALICTVQWYVWHRDSTNYFDLSQHGRQSGRQSTTLLVGWFSVVSIPANRFHEPKLTSVLLQVENHRRAVTLWSVSHFGNINIFLLISSARCHFANGDLMWSLFYGAVSWLELRLALGNSEHSSARAAGHW